MGVRVLHPRVEVTRGVVGRAAKEAGERQDGVVARVRHGLVAGDAFLRHQVGQGTAHARGAVFVVYVHRSRHIGGRLCAAKWSRIGCPLARNRT